MDDKDKLLIAALRKDARRPIVALARDLGLSRTATQERLTKLVASGAIARFTIEEGSAGTHQSAHLLVQLANGFKCAQVVPKLKSIATATVIHSVAGAYDIVVRLDAPDILSIEQARARIAATPGVASAVTLVTLEPHLN